MPMRSADNFADAVAAPSCLPVGAEVLSGAHCRFVRLRLPARAGAVGTGVLASIGRAQVGWKLRSKTSGNGFILGLSSPRSTMVRRNEVPPFLRLGRSQVRRRIHPLLGRVDDLFVLAAPFRHHRCHLCGSACIGLIGVRNGAHEASGDFRLLLEVIAPRTHQSGRRRRWTHIAARGLHEQVTCIVDDRERGGRLGMHETVDLAGQQRR